MCNANKTPSSRKSSPRSDGATAARRGETGQSLVIAVIVLFLLLFIGGVFVALVARNLANAQRAGNVSSASGFAEAGLRYLDEQLTNSPEGADWRPIPDSPPATILRPTPPPEVDTRDPDYFWLQRYKLGVDGRQFVGGFTRVNFGGPNPAPGNIGGRALVRITYQPIPPPDPNATDPPPSDPNSKYLKLEAIGRVGSIDENDPTTFGGSEPARLRRELVAYKAIGITDYARSIWNKDNKPVTAELGAPFVVYDRRQDDPAQVERRQIVSEYRGPIRVNTSLRWYGRNDLFLDPRRNDLVEVAGRIEHDENGPTTTPAPVNPTVVNITDASLPAVPAPTPALPSSDPGFEQQPITVDNLYRDGRSVARLAPPVIDAPTGAGGLTRYRALTRNAPPLAPGAVEDNPIAPNLLNNAGIIGWGTGMYINNRNDVQRESIGLSNAYSLRSDWLQPNTTGRAYWRGDFVYVPPAMEINLTPRYMKLTQSAYDQRSIFRDNQGRRIATTSILRYTDEDKPNTGIARTVNADFKYQGYPRGDFVLFAEGNIRIRGTLGGIDPETGNTYTRHLTVVSNGTIYVDGNLLRDNLPANDADRGRSSIALLARDYIVVNTTQFLNPTSTIKGWTEQGAGREIALRRDASDPAFEFYFSPGPQDDPANPQNNTPPVGDPSVFLRHSSEFTGATAGGQGASINLSLLNTNTAVPPAYFPFGGATSLVVPSQTFVDQVFLLDQAQLPPNTLDLAVGASNLLTINYDVSAAANVANTAQGLDGVAGSQAAYLASRVGIAPLDIRIEAFMYAQEGSFFVIPGEWFNPDPNDTFSFFRTANRRAGENLSSPFPEINPKFPFHREPMDVRVTIFGTVAENLPVQVGDQGAWLEKWGWTPRHYGHGTDLTAHQGRGLQFVFNDQGILPYARDENNRIRYENEPAAPATRRPTAVRRDIHDRTLPVAPRLPVAPGLLFLGENPR